MKNKGLILFSAFFLMFVNFVSAAYFGGFGGGYTLSDLLNTFDAQTVTLMGAFLISFVLIFLGLTKSIMKYQRAGAGVIAFAISFLLIYYMNQSGFGYYGFQGFFYDLGFSQGVLSSIISFLFIVVVIYSIIKLKFRKFLLISGILLLGLGVLSYLTNNFVYNGGILLVIGVVLLFIWFIFRKKDSGYGSVQDYLYERDKMNIQRDINKLKTADRQKKQVEFLKKWSGKGISGTANVLGKTKDFVFRKKDDLEIN